MPERSRLVACADATNDDGSIDTGVPACVGGTPPGFWYGTDTYEWTYESFTSSLSHHPAAWCLAGTSTCARFFGGQNSASRYALMWQWSGGGGSNNGYGDFDQIDNNRTP